MRRVVVIALVPVGVIAAAAAAVIWVTAPELARAFLHGLTPGEGAMDIRIVAPLVPLGALSACLIDGARGFGRMWPFLAIEGLGKPAARIALVLCALVAGLGLYGAIVAWGIPVAGGLAASSLIFAGVLRAEVPVRRGPRGTRKAPRRAGPPLALAARHWSARRRRRAGRHRRPPGRLNDRRQGLGAEFWRFTAPRAVQGTFQVVILWLDILLVGAMVSRYAAGVYAAVSKLALVGTFALEGNRLAIGPQLSALLARREYDRAAAAVPDRDPLADAGVLAAVSGLRCLPGRRARHLRAPLHGRRRGARRAFPCHARQSGDRQRDGGAADGREEFVERDQRREPRSSSTSA